MNCFFLVKVLLALSGLLTLPQLVIAQDAGPTGVVVPAVASGPGEPLWPTKPIRLVVPFATGSFTDLAARTVGAELSTKLGQPVVIENKSGADSTLGTDLVAKAAPDGYTFLVTDNSFAVSAALNDNLPYSPKDLMQVSLLADAPAVLVANPSLVGASLKQVVEFARNNPGKLTTWSRGQGSLGELSMEAFLLQNKLQFAHVPLKVNESALTAIAADRIDIAISSIGDVSTAIKEARLLGLAISSERRHVSIPNVPTFTEAGFSNYKMMYWFGMMAPSGTSPVIIDRMQKEIAKAVTSQQIIDAFATTGARAIATSPATFTKMVHSETLLWSQVITSANIQLN
jgi:tripartite-type tricarboxylate transporter receptor subunit TctC